MYRGEKARILPVIIVLIVIAVAIAGLVAAGRAIFGGNQPSATTPDISREALLNTSVGHSVRMTIRGPIVADEDFRSYQILVTPYARTLTTYSGYLETPIATKALGNNTKAYEELVYALDKANMVKAPALSGDQDDVRGICAAGRVLEFEVLEDTKTVKRLWTSSCKGTPGSLKANAKQLRSLFDEQIPEHKKLLEKIDL